MLLYKPQNGRVMKNAEHRWFDSKYVQHTLGGLNCFPVYMQVWSSCGWMLDGWMGGSVDWGGPAAVFIIVYTIHRRKFSPVFHS